MRRITTAEQSARHGPSGKPAERARRRALALELVESAPRGTERAEALVLLSDTCPLTEAIRVRREALGEPGLPAAQKVLIHQFLAVAVRLTEGTASAEFHAHTSLRL